MMLIRTVTEFSVRERTYCPMEKIHYKFSVPTCYLNFKKEMVNSDVIIWMEGSIGPTVLWISGMNFIKFLYPSYGNICFVWAAVEEGFVCACLSCCFYYVTTGLFISQWQLGIKKKKTQLQQVNLILAEGF